MLNGIPRFDFTVSNRTESAPTRLSDVFCLIGECEYGVFDTPTLVKSEKEYREKFGSLQLNTPRSISPVAIALLQAGVQLMIVRIAARDTDGTVFTMPKATVRSPGNGSIELTAIYSGSYGNYLQVRIGGSTRVANPVTLQYVTYFKFDIYYGNVLLESFSLPDAAIQPIDIETANSKLKFIQIGNIVGVQLRTRSFFTANRNFTDGIYVSAEDPTDYIGNKDLKTGLYALDKLSSIKFISAPNFYSNTLDLALAAYAEKRNAIVLASTPSGLTGTLPVAYRNATTPYTGTALDTYRTFMHTGHIVKRMRDDLGRLINYTLSPVYGAAVAISKKNRFGKTWENYAIQEYSALVDATGVDVNFGIDSVSEDATVLFNSGLNAFVQDEAGLVKLLGSSSLQKDYSPLSFTGNVELLQELVFRLRPIFVSYIGKANNIENWRLLANEVTSILDRYVEQGGLYSYTYDGDQNADNLNQLVVNNIDDITAGKYNVRLNIQLYSTMLYLSLDIMTSFAGVEFTVNQ